ncbi:hypothetical protein B0H13DRAFT_1855488 [Mycena leptocephala]|nr:hypothetical protein B0H13DRAFT_1855488 [Mycena leptocephala]
MQVTERNKCMRLLVRDEREVRAQALRVSREGSAARSNHGRRSSPRLSMIASVISCGTLGAAGAALVDPLAMDVLIPVACRTDPQRRSTRAASAAAWPARHERGKERSAKDGRDGTWKVQPPTVKKRKPTSASSSAGIRLAEIGMTCDVVSGVVRKVGNG